MQTKLFFVVESEESNPEIFEFLEEAQAYRISVIGTEKGSLLKVAMVRNYFFEPELKRWNYEDKAYTFNFIKIL
jgi:hypothetical protein